MTALVARRALPLGFALIVASIRLVPIFADAAGWRFALLPLAAGPLLGAAGMLRLRALPVAYLLAGGRRSSRCSTRT